jgi:hypothetical protein
VLAPKAVCRQWQIELREKFNLSWPIYDGHKLTWLKSPARRDIERSVDRARWHEEPFLIMSSHLARRLDRQREILEAAAPLGLNFQFCGALVNYDMPWNPRRPADRPHRRDCRVLDTGKPGVPVA